MDVYKHELLIHELGRPPLPFHVVLVMGYENYRDEPYYIIKNDHGLSWGMNGYTRVACDLLCGFCTPGRVNWQII